jgi:hypothetical protein
VEVARWLFVALVLGAAVEGIMAFPVFLGIVAGVTVPLVLAFGLKPRR